MACPPIATSAKFAKCSKGVCCKTAAGGAPKSTGENTNGASRINPNSRARGLRPIIRGVVVWLNIYMRAHVKRFRRLVFVSVVIVGFV
jgi:hypothetical protein